MGTPHINKCKNEKLTGALRSQDDSEENTRKGGGAKQGSERGKKIPIKLFSSTSSCDHTALGSFSILNAFFESRGEGKVSKIM